MVIEDDTVETDKNRQQVDTACPVLLYASGRSVYKRIALAWHYANHASREYCMTSEANLTAISFDNQGENDV